MIKGSSNLLMKGREDPILDCFDEGCSFCKGRGVQMQ